MTDPAITVGVDVGGTFTDVGLLVGTELTTAKVPTTDDQSVGVITGIKKAADIAGIDPAMIDAFVHATTVSVNALLERDGAKTALVTTAGFRDVLEIGRQDRPALYELAAQKPDPLVPRHRRLEIDERASPTGIERAVEDPAIEAVIDQLAAMDIDSVAVSFLHAYMTPENEQAVATQLATALDLPVSSSHEVLSEFREYERTATTVANAYVTPIVRSYLDRMTDRAATTGIPEPRIMQSNGGTAAVETIRQQAVTTVLSGPAAGVIGGAASAGDAAQLITFDMGGTSSDISLVRNGRAERTTDGTIGGVPIRTPMVDVNTVGAGGGSIAWVDSGGALRVGPQSAGADPGPACYGQGGEKTTVTDANVVLGYISPETTLGGELEIDAEAAYAALDRLATKADLEDAQAAAEGVYRVANATMTRTIRSVTVERGYDPREFGLVAFGGAGPIHAPALATALDIEEVLVPKPAGILSAYGLLAADEVHDAVRTVRVQAETADVDRINSLYDELIADVYADSTNPDAATIERAVDCRYVGQSFELTVPIEEFTPDAVREAFHDAHERTYGYTLDAAVEVVNLRVSATLERSAPTIEQAPTDEDPQIGTRTVWFPDEGRQETTVYDRARLAPNDEIVGPSVFEQTESTTVLPPGWTCTVQPNGTLHMEVTDD